MHLDLTGLPPTPDDIKRFLNDSSPTAYESKVSELIQSVHYGERWGRVWLDAARYADSDGFEKDKPRFVWFYRDWVVRALNADMPYDQFLLKQLYDPISHKDYYGLLAFINNCDEACITVFTPEEETARQATLDQVNQIVRDALDKDGDWFSRMNQWEANAMQVRSPARARPATACASGNGA